ncbi:hypothetical protein NEOLEDRAFT_216366 [Neolentinus lepideus HHB14362 ss-1]|uniref:Uncharacterized protein n=1 Tax=Neolentinus lepideus HHB14362 ss-1 TaxID=1314782 RepID=A0A165MCB6_9AGAM|nr:hypothetical protein NEOLEDRAFT_216366 [Neolentinus lepideus HHB14362 ss-1]
MAVVTVTVRLSLVVQDRVSPLFSSHSPPHQLISSHPMRPEEPAHSGSSKLNPRPLAGTRGKRAVMPHVLDPRKSGEVDELAWKRSMLVKVKGSAKRKAGGRTGNTYRTKKWSGGRRRPRRTMLPRWTPGSRPRRRQTHTSQRCLRGRGCRSRNELCMRSKNK